MKSSQALSEIYKPGSYGLGGTLPYSSSIYVPSTNGDKYLTPKQHLNVAHKVGEYLIDTFGGATVVPSFGLWRNTKTGKVVREPIYIVSSSYNPKDSPHWSLNNVYSLFNAIAYGLGRALNQVSVAVTHTGDHGHSMHFIDTHSGVEHNPAKGRFHFALGDNPKLHDLAEHVRSSIAKLIGGK